MPSRPAQQDDKKKKLQAPSAAEMQLERQGGAQAPLSLLVQRAQQRPQSLSGNDVLQLQRSLGNRATTNLLSGIVQRDEKDEAQQDAAPKRLPVRDANWKARRGLHQLDPMHLDPNSASSYKEFQQYPKNDQADWEIVFRGLQKVSEFQPEKEENFNAWDHRDFKGKRDQYLIDSDIAHTQGFIASSRDYKFSESVSGKGGVKGSVVYAAAIPRGFGIDVEAYTKSKNPDENSKAWKLADQAKEVSMLKMPRKYIIGWRSNRIDLQSGKTITSYHANPDFALPANVTLEDIPTFGRFSAWKAEVDQKVEESNQQEDEKVMSAIEEQEQTQKQE